MPRTPTRKTPRTSGPQKAPGPHSPPSVQRAKEIIQCLVENTAGALAEAARQDAQHFIGRWIAFNSVYTQYFNGSERNQLMACVNGSVSDADAQMILSRVQPEIQYFAALPPGDMRFFGEPARFRARSMADMAAVQDPTRSARERLAHLVAVVYQVRCNLIHGQKNPFYLRDHELIRAGDNVLQELLKALV